MTKQADNKCHAKHQHDSCIRCFRQMISTRRTCNLPLKRITPVYDNDQEKKILHKQTGQLMTSCSMSATKTGLCELTFQTEKECGSTTVGCTTSLPGNTPHVTAFTSECPTLLRTCNPSQNVNKAGSGTLVAPWYDLQDQLTKRDQ